MADRRDPVGVMDSGLGGISTLAVMTRILPGENFIYYGDTRNAPYGTKSTEEVIRLVRNVVAELEKDRIKALVIACNTATGAAAAVLRSEMKLPVIGMEPALKPASEVRQDGSILVMATPLTLRQEKFSHLMELYGKGAVCVPCGGLMELVEKQDEDGARAYLENLFAAYDLNRVDAIVLGCTHYVFLRGMIRKMIPEHICLLDGNAGTARQLRRVLAAHGLPADREKGSIVLRTSGDEETEVPLMKKMLETALADPEIAGGDAQ